MKGPDVTSMTLSETLLTVWQQALVDEKPVVTLGSKSYPVQMSLKKKLRTVEFTFGAHSITGIEQNPATKSVWAKLAREGKRIMQFSCADRYIGNVAEGRLTRYGAWQSLALPEPNPMEAGPR